jgi:hypothetical protein
MRALEFHHEDRDGVAAGCFGGTAVIHRSSKLVT